MKAAVVVELTHVASLYHDDVMDEARMRRGSASANSRWGNTVAILVGDLLFARASDIVCDLGPEFVRLQARTFSRLVQGQIAETVGPERRGSARSLPPGRRRQDRLLDRDVGAVWFQDLRCGAATCSGCMADFGEQIGVVFQLSDDIIDITSDETGKTPGTDLREGIPTLPTLLARRVTRPGRRPAAPTTRLRPARRRCAPRSTGSAAPPPLHRSGAGRGPPPRRGRPRPPRPATCRLCPRRPRRPLHRRRDTYRLIPLTTEPDLLAPKPTCT